MRCRQARALLPAHFEKELSEGNRRALEEHMAGCPRCHIYWRRLDRVEHRLMRAAQERLPAARPRDDFTASVMRSIAARQSEGIPGQAAPLAGWQAIPRTPDQMLVEEMHPLPVSPLGPWSAWDASTLGSWMLSSRVMLSGILALLFAVMATVVAVGVFLTQPILSTQALNFLASLFSHIADGFYGLVAMLSTLADNQLLLAGVAASYVSLALLWFYLMRHHEPEEVEP
jgi:anti-sigma factor RsiW